MANRKRGRVETQINVDLPIELAKELEDFCEDSRLPKKMFVELAVRRLLNEKRSAA